MKNVTREEAENILAEIGHHSHIRVMGGNRTVLNNAIVYNPFAGRHLKQIGMSSNDKNAKSAMKFIKDEFSVYSSVFSSYNGEYFITD